MVPGVGLINHQLQLMSTQYVENELLQLFDKLFQKPYLEKNIYIFNQMKPNLEIPISLIYKEKKISLVAPDETTILQALRKCPRVTVSEDGRSLKINIPLAKTKLTVTADPKALEIVPQLADSTLFGGYRIDADKANIVVNGNDPTQVASLKLLIEKETGLSCTVEDSDPFLDLKDSIEKAKQQKRERASYSGYESYPQWSGPNMYNFNPYVGGYERPRGVGFTRRAVESSDDDQPTTATATTTTTAPPERQRTKQRKQHAHPKEKDSPNDKETGKEKKPKYREKETKQAKELSEAKETKDSKQHRESKQNKDTKEVKVSRAQVEKRTRLNSQNFPEIEQQIEKEVLRIKYSKPDIVQIYMRAAPNIPISPQLENSGIPLLNSEGIFKLQAMKPGGRKESTFDAPKFTIVARKSST